ncbi:MAG TPA: hypothetical protein ENN67_01720, partial [Firmicutes bacterium]|nr:hypothetical protein [Bacillota bacterium]
MDLRKQFSIFIVALLFLGATSLGNGVRAIETIGPIARIDSDLPVMYGTEGMIPDTVIIEFQSYADARVAQVVNTFPGVAHEKAMTHRPVARYRILDGATPFETITLLRNMPAIKEVYPNYRRSAQLIPNDPYMQLQLEAMQVARIPAAWDIQTGSNSVLVAVIDTGVDETHPDLLPNLILPGVNVREDGSELVTDDSGHGTAVTGIIGAVGNNGIGIAGIAWSVRILPIRAAGGPNLDCDLFDEVEAIDVARERKANIINLSIGGIGTISIEEKAVTEAYNAGCLIVAAAGNGNPQFPDKLYFKATGDPSIDRHSLYYPAALPEVMGVGSVDNNG